jgi:ABC-2 type transport system permease protein
VRARALAETTGAQLPALEARRIGKLRQLEVLVGRRPTIQLNVDATRMSQAFIGNSYTQLIVNGEVIAFLQGHRAIATLPAEFEVRVLFNPNRSSVWFGSVMEVINSITMLCIVLAGMTLRLFATTSMGIFLGTVARSMPQMGLLMLIILLPLQMPSGGMPPRESMPGLVQDVMLAAPTTHFVSLAQAILYRGAGVGVVWPQLLALLAIGSVFFALALTRFRKTIGSMA